MNFKETGNKVPVTSQELIMFCQAKLAEFDESVSANKTIPLVNPYTDKMLYATKEGKTIMIPQEIQKQAVNFWYEQTGRNVPLMQQTNPEASNTQIIIPKEKPIVKEERDYIKLAILILAAMLALYLFIKIGNKSDVKFGLEPQRLRYYMTKN